MGLEPNVRADESAVRVEPDPHGTTGLTDVLGGPGRGHDLHGSDDGTRRTGRAASVRPPNVGSDLDDAHQVFVGGSRHRLVRLPALHREVVDRLDDEYHGEHEPDDRDLVQEVDLEVDELIPLDVPVGLDRLRVGEDP